MPNTENDDPEFCEWIESISTSEEQLETLISNPDYRTGLASSLKAGIAALPESTAGALILLADMPCVSVGLIDRLIQAFEESARVPLAVVPVRAGLRGNPALSAEICSPRRRPRRARPP